MKDLLFFVKLFQPYKLWLIIGSFLAILTALASIFLLTLSGWFITSSAIAGLLAPDGVAITFNFLLPAAQIRALAIIRTVSRYGERVVTHEATFRVLTEIRCWFFAKLIPLAPGRLVMHRSADLLNGMTQDINALDVLYLRIFSPLMVAIIGGGCIVAFIAVYSMKISFFVFVMLLITGSVTPWIFIRLGRESAKKAVQLTAKFKVAQIEILQGFAELTAFNAYTRFKKQITNVSEQMLSTQTENHRLSVLSSVSTGLLSQISVLIAIVSGSILFQQGNISAAVMVMLSFSVLGVFELIAPLSSSIQMLVKTQTAANRIRQITELAPVIEEAHSSQRFPSTGGISIKQLYFRYSEHSDWVLNNINLHIAQGSKIAIVGNSGTGKTTLLQLLMRFYDPQQGRVEYAGIDYRHLSSVQLMEQITFLSQQTQLFATTIKQNLLIAKPAASDFEINQAIENAGLNGFIKKLPEGINSWVGENGVKVSAGEARRIALARVYLKNAPILLLDEPTEGLDRESEDEVLNALRLISQQKTLVMMTHRQAGLSLVDKVFKITEKGGLEEI